MAVDMVDMAVAMDVVDMVATEDTDIIKLTTSISLQVMLPATTVQVFLASTINIERPCSLDDQVGVDSPSWLEKLQRVSPRMSLIY